MLTDIRDRGCGTPELQSGLQKRAPGCNICSTIFDDENKRSRERYLIGFLILLSKVGGSF